MTKTWMAALLIGGGLISAAGSPPARAQAAASAARGPHREPMEWVDKRNPGNRLGLKLIREELDEARWQARVPGLSFARRTGTDLEFHTYGRWDPDVREPAGPDTVFPAGALGEPVVAYISATLADEGRLDLDAPLAAILPLEGLSDPRGEGITARQVLAHAAGIVDGEPAALAFDPGSGFLRSVEGYRWLQRGLERLTGASLEALARERVFEPLGMSRSTFASAASVPADHAVAGQDVRRRRIEATFPAEAGATSLWTTAEDYRRFALAVWSGEGLSEAAWRGLTEPVVDIDDDTVPESARGRLAFALGWNVERFRQESIVWRASEVEGFHAFVGVRPRRPDIFVVLTNSSEGLALARMSIRSLWGIKPVLLDWLDAPSFVDPAFAWRYSVLEGFDESPDVGTRVLQAYMRRFDGGDAELLRVVAETLEAEGNTRAADEVRRALEAH